MTTYIEKFLRWLMPKGNFGFEDGRPGNVWGQMWVHLFLGLFFVCVPVDLVRHFGLWGLFGLIVPIGLPFYREFIHDKHPICDLWVDTPQGRDCRSDIASCIMGSVCGALFFL